MPLVRRYKCANQLNWRLYCKTQCLHRPTVDVVWLCWHCFAWIRSVTMPSSWALSDCLIYCTNSYKDLRESSAGCDEVSGSSGVTSSTLMPPAVPLYCCGDAVGGFFCCTDIMRAVTGTPHQLTSTLCTTSRTSSMSLSFWWMWVNHIIYLTLPSLKLK